MKIKKALVLASTCLLCFPLLFSPVIATSMPVFAIDNYVELPKEPEILDQLASTTETKAPIFSFEEKQESPIANKQFQLVVRSSQEVSEFVLKLPKGVSIVEDQQSTDSKFTNIEGNQWQVQTDSPQVTFSIPLMVEEAGEYEVTIGESTKMLNIQVAESQQHIDSPEIKSSTDSKVLTDQGVWGTVPWSYYEDEVGIIVLGGGTAGSVSDAPWRSYFQIRKIIFEDQVILPSDSSGMFRSLTFLESIENADKIDVSNVTNMESMFQVTWRLREIDVSNWDTSNVTNMRLMFGNLGATPASFTTLDLASWDTSSVTNMSQMFMNAQSLTTLDLRAWDTSNVTDMSDMFLQANSLTTLDLGTWNTSKVTNMSRMFNLTRSLTQLNLSSWDTSSVTNMSQMFSNTNLKSLTLGEKSLFSAATQLPVIQQIDGYTGGWKLEPGTEDLGIRYASSSEFMTNYDGRFPGTYSWETFGMWGTVPWIYDGILRTITLYGGEAGSRGDAPWKTYSSVKQIIVEDQVILPSNSTALFWALPNLESIDNAGRFDTSNVTSMYNMFGGTNNIKTLDLSNWDTSKVTDMAFMFNSNRNLETLNISNWNTSNVTNMRAMFQATESLTALDVSSWNTSNVTDMGWMFFGNRRLESLNISNWNTTNVSVATSMFSNTTNLSELRLGTNSRFDHLASPPTMPTITSSDNYTGNWVYYLNQANTIPEAYIASSSANFWQEYDGSNPGTYQWQKKGSVVVHYRDINDQEIIASEIITGGIREPFQIEEKAIEGYTLQEIPDNTSGRFTEVEQAVIFRYMKNTVDPVDPLNPEIEVYPENKPDLPEDQGLLSIDFVSSFNFGSQAISIHDQTYYAQPQRLLNEDGTVNENEVRPNYVQISDRRPESERNGWELAVTQQEQFKGKENQVLNGASITLLNQQVVTAQGGTAPELQSVHPLIPGNRQRLLKAQGSEGMGTWIYRFGDADTAEESVTLNVPKGANPEATTYSTKLTWELSRVPDN
ncbi:hypothetical protein IGK16_002979 [Enterococcus pernyi]